MRILGIDPGTATVGYGVIDVENHRYQVVDYGCIRTAAHMYLPERLDRIYQGVQMLIRKYRPQEVAVEELFFNTNITTGISVGQARGVIMLAAWQEDIIIGEYTPLQVKQALVGYGRAEKQQVQYMVKTFLNMAETPRPDDAADALALAICHSHARKNRQEIKG